VKAILTKRSVTKIAELSALQALSLIEAMRTKLAGQPPFEPGPEQPGQTKPGGK
jgi:hypothetical protein